MPAYLAGENPQVKEAVHQTVKELNKKGILEVEWVPGEKGNLLKRVSLNLDRIEAAYKLTGRVPKRTELEEINNSIQAVKDAIKAPWIKEFLSFCQEEISTRLTLPSSLPKEKQQLELVLKALQGLDQKGEEEVLERVFSIRYLGDSKLFTRKVRPYIINAARSYYLQDVELTAEDVLYELGLVKTTEEFLLAGPLLIEIQGKPVDLALLSFGTVIDTQMVNDIKIGELKARKVLLVENKTNFHYLTRKGLPADLLLIYLGGFPGPKKRQFLTCLYSFCRDNKRQVEFIHWGDLDWGGLRIHQLLREKAIPTLRPLYMDAKTLLAYKNMGESLSSSYRNKLIKQRQSSQYEVFHSLIDLMLELNIKLEQEALLADNNFVLTL